MKKRLFASVLFCLLVVFTGCQKHVYLTCSEDLPENVKKVMIDKQIPALHTKMKPWDVVEHFSDSQNIVNWAYLDKQGNLCHLLAYTIGFQVSISFSFVNGKMENAEVFYQSQNYPEQSVDLFKFV